MQYNFLQLPPSITSIIPFTGDYLVYISIAIFVGLIIFSIIKKTFNIAVLSLIALPLTFLTTKILQIFIEMERPFLNNSMPALISADPNVNSFPSIHTLAALVIGLIIFSEFKCLGILLVFVAGIIGYSRILANVHNPVDILGSVVIAIVVIIISKIILAKIWK